MFVDTIDKQRLYRRMALDSVLGCEEQRRCSEWRIDSSCRIATLILLVVLLGVVPNVLANLALAGESMRATAANRQHN